MYSGDNVRAVFRVAMEQFALNFAPYVTVPEPKKLLKNVGVSCSLLVRKRHRCG